MSALQRQLQNSTEQIPPLLKEREDEVCFNAEKRRNGDAERGE